jgi:hypothetical protein
VAAAPGSCTESPVSAIETEKCYQGTKHFYMSVLLLVSENLALAPVLATSKLLGMMENNKETRQKQEAPYQIQSNPGFKTTTAN